jgi:hypothetical protein
MLKFRLRDRRPIAAPQFLARYWSFATDFSSAFDVSCRGEAEVGRPGNKARHLVENDPKSDITYDGACRPGTRLLLARTHSFRSFSDRAVR